MAHKKQLAFKYIFTAIIVYIKAMDSEEVDMCMPGWQTPNPSAADWRELAADYVAKSPDRLGWKSLLIQRIDSRGRHLGKRFRVFPKKDKSARQNSKAAKLD